MTLSKNLKVLLFISLLLFYAFLIAHPINLVTADLGRHLKNGQLILSGNFSVLHSNLYSYTYQDYPFINHHWLTGVVFYLTQRIAGFGGLSILLIILSLATFSLFFDIGRKYASFEISVLSSLLIIPLLGSRVEIRPELFSYLLCAVFFWILFKFKEDDLSRKALFILPVLELIWVNLHIYFFFGIALIGVFLLDSLLNHRSKVKDLAVLLLVSFLVTLINPSGLNGVLYPLHIFDNYGYRLLENQSIFYLDKLKIAYPSGPFFKVLVLLVLASLIYYSYNFFKKKVLLPIIEVILTLTFTALALLAVRNFAIFGYFTLALLPLNIRGVRIKSSFFVVLISLLLLSMFYISPDYWQGKNQLSLGLVPGNDQAAKFYLSQNLKGPIFNNYDIGGYLIYYLYPKEKVLLDNRPEAYPASFFQNDYIPMQQDSKKWAEEDSKYHFNVVFFNRLDYTEWGQKFLVERIKDSSWAPVYVDQQIIIFLKRNQQNQDIIKQFELPKDMFRVGNS